MSLASNISDAFTRVATEFRAIRTLIGGGATSDITALSTTNKTSLVAAINEVKTTADNAATSGGAQNLDQLSDVVIQTGAGATPAAGHVLRHDGTAFTNVLGSTYFQPADSDLSAIAALTTTAYGRALLELANQAALVALLPSASGTAIGLIQLATSAEVTTGTDAVKAVTPATLQAKLGGYQAAGSYQPLDSDLTAIAALTTTSYGRAFLALADQAALMTLMRAASETVTGIVELATTAESTTGTDTTRATHPAGVKAAIDQRIDNNSALGTSTTNAPSQAAVKAYADALIAANDAMVFKGTLDASLNPNYPAANRGDTYKISVAGKIGGASGPNVEVGDLVICAVDGTAAGTQATVGATWTIVQTNIDGAVTGPTSSVSGNLASFSGTSGKLVQDSGIAVDTTTTLGTSNAKVPTQNAVKVYADTKQPLDATLTALAAVTTAANQLIYATGADAFAVTTLSAFGRTLIDDADAATARATLSTYSQAEIGDPATDFVTPFVTALTA